VEGIGLAKGQGGARVRILRVLLLQSIRVVLLVVVLLVVWAAFRGVLVAIALGALIVLLLLQRRTLLIALFLPRVLPARIRSVLFEGRVLTSSLLVQVKVEMHPIFTFKVGMLALLSTILRRDALIGVAIDGLVLRASLLVIVVAFPRFALELAKGATAAVDSLTVELFERLIREWGFRTLLVAFGRWGTALTLL